MSENTNPTAGDEFEIELDVAAMKEPEAFKGLWHDAVIKSVRPSISARENRVINVQWVISDDDPEFAKRSVFDAITFTADAEWKIKQFMAAIGQGDFKGKLRPSDLVGERARIKVGMEKSSGINEKTGEPFEPRPRVQRYAPAGSAGSDLENLIG